MAGRKALLLASALTILCPPVAAENGRLRYQVTLLPESRSLLVAGELEAFGDIGGWIAAAPDLPKATVLDGEPGRHRFAYALTIPERERSDSPETELDAGRLRGWGGSLFLVPAVADGEPGPIEICFDLPRAWAIATLDGDGRCARVDDVDSLFALPILAGDFAVLRSEVGATRLVIAVRHGHPIPVRTVSDHVERLVAGAAAYFGAPLPERLFVGIDRLAGRSTYAPGNNRGGPAHSATLLIDGDSAPDSWRFLGTLAHELAHGWIPRGFGQPQVTREELGSTFGEGFTDYLAYRLARFSGLLSDDRFMAALSRFYLEYREAAARTEGNPEFLRYRQGMMAAWMLDLELLKASGGRAGFRELMRLLMTRHAATDGLTRAELKDALRTLGGDGVAAMYDPLTDAARPIDFERHLAGTAIRLLPTDDFTAAIDAEVRAVRRHARSPAPARRLFARWMRG